MALAFRPFRFSAPCLIVIVALCFMSTGCGSKHPGLVKVGGTVTLDGEPVTDGKVRFYPEEGRPSSGTIGSDGRYELRTYEKNDGAKPGIYTVTVESLVLPKANNEPTYKSFEDEMKGVVTKPQPTSNQVDRSKLVPRRYSARDASEIQVEIIGAAADVDLVLTTKR